MLLADAALFLPVSERTLGALLGSGGSLEGQIARLSVAQVGALVVLQSLVDLKGNSRVVPERLLANAIATGNAQAAHDGHEAFIASALNVLDRERIRQGSLLLPNFGIALLDDATVGQARYLKVDGGWDSSFRERHREQLIRHLQRIDGPNGEPRRILSAEQTRIWSELKAQSDDHLHVQGYAGTGKSFLITSLLDILASSGAQVLLLAERKQQLDALLFGQPPRQMYAKTFGMLADEMIPANLTAAGHRRTRRGRYFRAPVSDSEVIRFLGVCATSEFQAQYLVEAVRATVVRYCYSGDEEIDRVHIPEQYAARFDSVTQNVVLHHATELWKATVSPLPGDFRPPVRDFHRIKLAALGGWKIPSRYTHVLIDECHHLSRSMLQIVDNATQAVISLGDEYQNLRGTAQSRSGHIRHREVTQAVRSGPLIEQMVNPIIAVHPARTKSPFVGNQLQKTVVEFYSTMAVPEQATTILVCDPWGLFEWSQRLAMQNLDFELIGNAADLNLFVSGCIDLFHRGARARHARLFRFDTWDAVAARYHSNAGFQRIDRMLRKGYSSENWARASQQFVKRRNNTYALGLIEDAHNREFESVMLAPEVADFVWSTESREIAEAGSAVYVAVTRARRRLLVPERLRHWIEQVSGSA